MPTIFSHPAPILALGVALGRRRVSSRLLFALAFFAVAPDVDAIGFYLGVPYASWLGHRGFSHSLVFAVFCGLVGAGVAPWLKASRLWAGALVFLAVASHIALDALTSGGLGVAALWPFSDTRYFFPWHPIRVSPMSLARLFSERGAAVFYSEFLWIWLPSLALILASCAWRFMGRRK
ncbi:MAG: metal-dependent hydrolase [Zoogloeaceae bacterium]|jgi:inner membrane protein|nr:metal-dependent hydrolase [Zoogloeaceae bacterium]